MKMERYVTWVQCPSVSRLEWESSVKAVCGNVFAVAVGAALWIHVPEVQLANATTARYGLARVVDGDTIVVNKARIRLFGIDAPELKQSCRKAGGEEYACGYESKKHLESLLHTQSVRCLSENKDM